MTRPLPKIIALLAALVCACAATPALRADDVQGHADILAAAHDFLTAQLQNQPDAKSEIRLGSLDPRLRLPACDRPLEGFLPPGGHLSGNTSVGVACPGTQTWKLYVQAYVAVFRTVAVAAAYLPAGAALGADTVRFEERDVTAGGYGYLTDIEQVRDRIVKQPVQEGRIIPPQALTRAKLIRRGETVVILSRSGSIEVRMSGSALMDGAAGDRIRVRNAKSQRIIEGKVEAPGLVMVSM